MNTVSTPRTTTLALLWVCLQGCGSAEDHRAATWDYISPVIFQPSCATVSCHSRAAAVAGLDFSDPERGYTSLTQLRAYIVDPNAAEVAGCKPESGTIVCLANNRPLITPYVPAQSRIVNMLKAQGAARMPPDRPLTSADIALVERWILNGAKKIDTDPSILDAAVAAGPDAGATPVDATDAAGARD